MFFNDLFITYFTDAASEKQTDDIFKDATKAENINKQKVKVLTTPAVRRIAAQFKVS